MSSEDNGPRRAKRRCARGSRFASSVPSAVHYVGYVEDDETPEMIMAKFAELEKIKQTREEAKATTAEEGAETTEATVEEGEDPRDQDLSDEQLLEVFKQTSMFSVKTALQDNEMLMSIDELLEQTNERYGDDDVSDDEFLRSFWSDDEDFDADAYSEDEYGVPRRKRRGSGGGGRGGNRLPRNAAGVKARHNVVTAYNPNTNALVRRKVRATGRDDIIQVMVPNPLPLSWGRTVKPYVPADKRGTRKEAIPVEKPVENAENDGGNAAAPPPAAGYLELESMVGLDVKALPTSGYQAVLINPGWEDGEKDPYKAVGRLAKMPLPRMVPSGFVFIWTDKQYVQAVFKQMTKWGYIYIENLTWVMLGANNKILTLDSEHICKSHLTLYMFRMAGKGKDIELRHQRNPDVTFDCVAKAECQPAGIPEETFVAIETLLPTGRGKYLELWAPKGVQRPGWTHVVDLQAADEEWGSQ